MALLLLLLAASSVSALADEPRFSAAERTQILAHGPWPPAFAPYPGNPLSGQTAAIAWGRELLGDPRLSRGRDASCISCHEQFGAFTDGKPTPKGLHRNTLALANLAGRRRYGWTGGEATLWRQSILPIVNPLELGATPALIAARVREHDDLRERFRQVTGADPAAAGDMAVLEAVGKALAAYQETLVTPRTRFDRFRDALASGDTAGMADYPAAAKRGLTLFLGRCRDCHAGPAFTDDALHGPVVPGGAKPPSNPATQPPIKGKWRTPALRNVAHTAPYMHDGSVATLAEAIRHHSVAAPSSPNSRLSGEEIADLVSFLETLSGTPRP